MKNFDVLFYWQSGRTFSSWIGVEYQHAPGSKVWLLEFGFYFFYIELSYDKRYTNYTEL
jgi:hypothetical protein